MKRRRNQRIAPLWKTVFFKIFQTVGGMLFGRARNVGVVGKHFIYTWGSGVSDADNYYIVTLEGISIKATCPFNLVVIDPDYLVISKEYSEIPEAVYIEEDFNGDGSPDDYVFIPESVFVKIFGAFLGALEKRR